MSIELPLYEYVMVRLDAKVRSQRKVADESGVPFSTLAKIAQRQVREPSVHTVQRLADYFRALDSQPKCTCGAKCDEREA